MPPEEVRRLSETKAIIFKEKARPILADKIRYYTERRFKKLLCDPPPVEETPAAVVVTDKAKASVGDVRAPLETGDVTATLAALRPGEQG